jgi:glycosyltransferase involved in cell wall biosynthesis
MKILQIADIPNWAIGHLADITVRHNPQFSFRTLYVHPKEVTEEKINMVKEHLVWADIVDLQYWNTARQLLEALPELREKKLVLTHHNQKDLTAYDWKDIDHHVVHTNYSAIKLAEAGYENITIIPYGFDLNYFKYSDVEPKEMTIGYCGRVVPWKGLKEVARACFELNVPLLMMGKIDKPNYWAEIPDEHKANIDFAYHNAPDDMRYEFYRDITIYVGNSGPNHEEGTMPLQEAMACGVPVVTTPSGVAMDIIENEKNGLIVEYDNYESLKSQLQKAIGDKQLRQTMRENAWNTIKFHTEERMAWEFQKVFYNTLHRDSPLVSVIIPCYNNGHEVANIIHSAKKWTYPNFELVFCDDNSTDGTYNLIASLREEIPELNIKYVKTENQGYGLAEARNRGVIEAQGAFLMFNDARLLPFDDAISQFMVEMSKHEKKKVWLFGEKGSKKQSFVENFSFIRRDYFIRAGMMSERIEQYGGMSQELRARFQWQGFEPVYTELACAKQMVGSKKTDKRRQDIIKSKMILWKMGLK